MEIGQFSVALPARSLRQENGRFKFEGRVGGVRLELAIRSIGARGFAFTAEGEGPPLAAALTPERLRLTIGDDTGTATLI